MRLTISSSAALFLLLLQFSLLSFQASAQTKLSLGQLPGCAINSGTTTPSGVPILLAIVPASNGISQFACYTLSGVTISPATATTPATITIPNLGVALPLFATNETPSGALNGANTSFTLASAPVPAGSLMLFRNGVLQCPSTSVCPNGTPDYAVAGALITFGTLSTPQPGDVLLASYRH